jgi:hypothetical protein
MRFVVIAMMPPFSGVAWAALVTRLRKTWLICEGEHDTCGMSPKFLRTSLNLTRLRAIWSVLSRPSCRSNRATLLRSSRLKFLRFETSSEIWLMP